MAIRIGITGGIGSGKSVVSRILQIMGCPVYFSDNEAKRIINDDESIRRQLKKMVGNDVYIKDGLNRALLSSFMFSDLNRVERVNAIVHPVVKNDFRNWYKSFPADKLVAIESAILIESGFIQEVDFVVMVSAPLEIRVERTMFRDSVSRASVMKRINAQMNDEEKCRMADYTIINNGETPLIPQVLELISLLSKNNHYLCYAKNNL